MIMIDRINPDALLAVIFETIEGVRNINDDKADLSEVVSVDQAKAIRGLAEQAIEIYKVKSELVRTIARAENPAFAEEQIKKQGL